MEVALTDPRQDGIVQKAGVLGVPCRDRYLQLDGKMKNKICVVCVTLFSCLVEVFVGSFLSLGAPRGWLNT